MEKTRTALATNRVTPHSGVPYPPSSETAALTTATVSTNPTRRITPHNFLSFECREKALPPDACVEKAPRMKMYQFPDRVSFYCSKCRKDGISADALAYDSTHQIMMCIRCFERLIRPKKYKPSRVVPFPSLLSWLNYRPAPVLTTVSDDVMSRPAEAAAPSGKRAATEMLGGTDVRGLRATPMLTAPKNPRGTRNVVPAVVAATPAPILGNHPCLRAWGSCVHGDTCLFRSAPAELCLAYLMGLCDRGSNCALLHQDVFELPTQPPVPRPRRSGDLLNADSPISEWLARKKISANRAEWQLFHNGSLKPMLDLFVPEEALPEALRAPEAPLNPADAVAQESAAPQAVVPEALSSQPSPVTQLPSSEADSEELPVQPLSLKDITSALKFLKK